MEVFIYSLHRVDSSGNDDKYGDTVEVTPDKDGNWSYKFKRPSYEKRQII